MGAKKFGRVIMGAKFFRHVARGGEKLGISNSFLPRFLVGAA